MAIGDQLARTFAQVVLSHLALNTVTATALLGSASVTQDGEVILLATHALLAGLVLTAHCLFTEKQLAV